MCQRNQGKQHYFFRDAAEADFTGYRLAVDSGAKARDIVQRRQNAQRHQEPCEGPKKDIKDVAYPRKNQLT